MLISEKFELKPTPTLLNTSSDRLVSDGGVGIEIEVEGLPLSIQELKNCPEINTYWEVVEDGSLRNYDGTPAEFVFRGPMFGEDVVRALTDLHELIGDPTASCRTSVHVHLDVRDLSYSQLCRLVCLYVLVEPVFFAKVAPHRRSNSYCTPLGESQEYLERLGAGLVNREGEEAFLTNIGFNQGGKYTALNLIPVQVQGSVEFRHKEGTTDPDTLLEWVNMILSLKEEVLKEETITTEELTTLVSDYPRFVRGLFPFISGMPDVIYNSSYYAGISAKTILLAMERAEASQDAPRYCKSSLFWAAFPDNTILRALTREYDEDEYDEDEYDDYDED